MPLHPFCQGVGQPTGVSIIEHASAFFVLTAYPSHSLLAADLQLCILAFAAFSSRAEMLCDAVEI